MVGKDYKATGSVDAVVISGSGYRSVRSTDDAEFAGVLDLIKSFEGPVLACVFCSSTHRLRFQCKTRHPETARLR